MTPHAMAGKRCVITGATTGIGKETARGLARLGASVVLVGRDASRGEAAAEAIRTSVPDADVTVMLADLGSQRSIRHFADDYKRRFDQLHVLVNNAGAIFPSRQITVDGFENTWATNHLAYALVTELLLDVLKASAPARVVNVSSAVHTSGRIDFADMQSERSFRPMRAYSQSKLANILFTYELARRLEGSGVTANALHPGLVASEFGRREPGLLKFLTSLLRPAMISVEAGALTSIHVATAAELEGVTGRYYVKSREVRSAPVTYDETLARRLWEETERLTRPVTV